jgi:hypothetical protein
MAANSTRPRWRKIAKRVFIAVSVVVLVVGAIAAGR